MKHTNNLINLLVRLTFFILFGINLQTSGSSTSSGPALPRFNKKTFEANAALYGNKTANLMELEKIVAYLNQIQNVKIFAVPPFFGISSPEVIAYLQKMPYEQTTVWNYILTQWDLFIAAQPQDNMQLTNAARAALTNIRAALTATEFDASVIVNEQHRHDRLKTFLGNAVEQDKLLMVRSTGREDGKELSNAGGNTSISSVPPEIKALSDAITEVLTSYSSEKSIGQRLVGKDKHLYDTPFMAVLLQVMIGEIYRESTEIPKSGVMFSPEAEGETPGVVVIQATFGHNEGVVNGLVPIDTYYIGPSNIIHPVISIKLKRLATVRGRKDLQFVPNEPAIQRISTLDPETILVLKNAAQFVQNYYNNSVDIEFVILGNIIYLVQARPLEAKKFEASYLNNNFIKENTAPVLSITPIGTGNSAVRIIERQDQVIITDNIRRALDTFLTKTPDKNAVQAIIVQEWAPNTSHEATQFRRLGKPVLYLQDLHTIKTWLQQLGTTQNSSGQPSTSYAATSSSTAPIHSPLAVNSSQLLIDVQRALITQFIPTESFETPESAIELGWYAHPIAKKVSLMPEFFPKLSQEQMRELEPKEFFNGLTTNDLIEIIKSGEPEPVHYALQSILHRTLSALRNIEATQKMLTRTHPQLIPQLKHIFACMLSSAHEIREALKNEHPERLELLYPIVFLEALLRQIPEPKRLVNDYSFGSILKTELLERAITQELHLEGKALRAYIVQYAKAGKKALVPETKKQWDTFLQQLSNIEDQNLQQQFARLMLNIQRFDALPLWLNSSFVDAYTKYANARDIARALLSEYNPIAQFLNYLQALHESLSSFDTSSFEDPVSFKQQTDTLMRYIQPLATPQFMQQINTIQGLGLLLTVQVMNKAIETIDTSIKALSGSTSYSDIPEQKVIRFKQLIHLYFNLFKHWAAVPRIHKLLDAMIDIEENGDYFANPREYVNMIGKALKETNTDLNQFEPSTELNVAAATLGSRANWRRSVPEKLSLEDLFTLIHQNLLVITGALTPRLNAQALPNLFNDTVGQIQSISVEIDEVSLDSASVGVSFINDTLTYLYNLPLRNHSCTFQVAYDLNKNEVTLAVQFFGHNENARWTILGDMAFILSKLNNMQLEKPIEIDDETKHIFSFTWQIKNAKQARTVKQFIEYAGAYTFEVKGIYPGIKIIARSAELSIDEVIDIIISMLIDRPSLSLIIPKKLTAKQIEKFDASWSILMNSFFTYSTEKQEDIWNTIDHFFDVGTQIHSPSMPLLVNFIKQLYAFDKGVPDNILSIVIKHELALGNDEFARTVLQTGESSQINTFIYDFIGALIHKELFTEKITNFMRDITEQNGSLSRYFPQSQRETLKIIDALNRDNTPPHIIKHLVEKVIPSLKRRSETRLTFILNVLERNARERLNKLNQERTLISSSAASTSQPMRTSKRSEREFTQQPPEPKMPRMLGSPGEPETAKRFVREYEEIAPPSAKKQHTITSSYEPSNIGMVSTPTSSSSSQQMTDDEWINSVLADDI